MRTLPGTINKDEAALSKATELLMKASAPPSAEERSDALSELRVIFGLSPRHTVMAIRRMHRASFNHLLLEKHQVRVGLQLVHCHRDAKISKIYPDGSLRFRYLDTRQPRTYDNILPLPAFFKDVGNRQPDTLS